MAKAKRTPALPKESEHRKQSPSPTPHEPAECIARCLDDAMALFRLSEMRLGPPPYYLPVDAPLQEQCRCYRREDAEAVNLEADYDAVVKRAAARDCEFDAACERLASDARAVAGLLADADLNWKAVLAFAVSMESWKLRMHDGSEARCAFEAARLALDEGKLHYEAKARKATATGGEPERRRGRMAKDESEARRNALLAKVVKYPKMMEDIPALASEAGVSAKQARRWVKQIKEDNLRRGK